MDTTLGFSEMLKLKLILFLAVVFTAPSLALISRNEHEEKEDYTFDDLVRAVSREDVDQIKRILTNKPDLVHHQISTAKLGILDFSCVGGSVASTKALIEMGANVNSQDADGHSPLHMTTTFLVSAWEDHHACAELLIKNGAKIDGLLNKPAPKSGIAKPPFIRSPLAKAADLGDYQFVELMLKHGASSTRAYTPGRFTPLHFACNPFADPETLKKQGNIGNEKVIRLLLQYGAKFDVRDLEEHTPESRAKREKRQDILDAIKRIRLNPDPVIQFQKGKPTNGIEVNSSK